MKEFQHNYTDDKKSMNNISSNRIPIILLLDGLNDMGNVGMVFRIADALRIQRIYFYNYNEELNNKLLQRKSRATSKYVEYSYLSNITDVTKLKEVYEIIILDKTNKSIPYSEYEFLKPICLVLGAEITGVSQELIDIGELSLHLPMNGINTSINVATATSVVLYDMYNKIKNNGKF